MAGAELADALGDDIDQDLLTGNDFKSGVDERNIHKAERDDFWARGEEFRGKERFCQTESLLKMGKSAWGRMVGKGSNEKSTRQGEIDRPKNRANHLTPTFKTTIL